MFKRKPLGLNAAANIESLLLSVPEFFSDRLETPLSDEVLTNFKDGVIEKSNSTMQKIGLKIPVDSENFSEKTHALAVLFPKSESLNIEDFSNTYIQSIPDIEKLPVNLNPVLFSLNTPSDNIDLQAPANSSNFIVNVTEVLRIGNEINFDLHIANTVDNDDSLIYDTILEVIYMDEDGDVITSHVVLPLSVYYDSTRYNIRLFDAEQEVFDLKCKIHKFISNYRDVLIELEKLGVEERVKKLTKIKTKTGKYQFWRYKSDYDPNDQANNLPFEKIAYSQINPNKKTLILLHGVFNVCFKFNNTGQTRGKKGTFKHLLPNEDQILEDWFKRLLEEKPDGMDSFEQIIALDRPNVFESPVKNLERLNEIFTFKGGREKKNKPDNNKRNKKIVFKEPVSIIAKSQGGFLARLIATSDLEEWQTVDRIALISSGYISLDLLSAAVHTILSIVGAAAWPLIIPFGFVPFKILKELPGIKAHLQDSDTFKTIYTGNTRDIAFFNITNNKNAGTNKRATDGLVSLAAQKGYKNAPLENCLQIHEGIKAHTEALTDKEVLDKLVNFLWSPLPLPYEDTIAADQDAIAGTD